MANKIVQLHDEANNNIYPVTTLDAIHGSGALRADFVLKQGDTMTGPLTATKFVGPVQGNADSATKLTSNAGTSKRPIYFSNGTPVQCSNTLENNIIGSIGEMQHNKTKITTYLDNSANIHKADGIQGEMNVYRFFAAGDEANYNSSYALPCVDSHNLCFSIDGSSSAAWQKVLTLDIRSDNIFTLTKKDGVWGNWVTLLNSSNYSNYLDGRYVNTAGDTMTG
jgi:hypothetical protein